MSGAVRTPVAPLSVTATLAAATLAAATLEACHRVPSLAPRPLALAPAVADSVRSETVARGATLHTIVNLAAPWRAYVLDVDLRCTRLQAVKGAPTAIGRLTTTQLLQSVPAEQRAIGAVNADFFLFTPPGVPTNAHIEQGVLISGPDNRPVFWRGANGQMGFDSVRATGSLVTATGTLTLNAWNRPAPRTSGVVDARWGVPLDTVVRKRFWRLDPVRVEASPRSQLAMGGRYVVRTGTLRDTLVHGDTLLLHLAVREAAPREGDTVTVGVRIAGRDADAAGTRITDAVGGRPILLADSLPYGAVSTEGQDSFRDLNPRTYLGLDRRGTRAWLVVVDGRQKGYSMGMTLAQAARFMQALGATRAINLDGGGSSALVLREATGATRTVNKPSDAGAERPVANAVVVASTCR